MIFWDQFKDKIEDDEKEEGGAEGGSGKGDGGKEEKPKSPEPKPKAPPIPAAAKSSEPIDAEFEGFEEKSDTSFPDTPSSVMPKKPDAPKKVVKAQNSSSAPKPIGRFKSLFSKDDSNKNTLPKGGNRGGSSGGDGGSGSKEKGKIPNWNEDLFESVITQRNILFFFTIICVLTIAMSVLLIRYVKNTQTIEPFVIEIEEKSGVPTVVTPVSTRVYSSDEAIKRYFIMKYIRAREEYFPSTFQDNFFNVVRVLSAPSVYYSDYRPKFSISNPNSPYNIYGESSNRRVVLKSLIFQSPKTAQVRIAFEINGIINLKQNKIVLMDFDFTNIEMNDEERFINPLGFQVTFYRIEDESN